MWLLKRISDWFASLLEEPQYDPRPKVNLPPSGFLTLDTMRASLIGVERRALLTQEMVDAFFLLNARDPGWVADYALTRYWRQLSMAAACLTPDEWLSMDQTCGYITNASSAREIKAQFDTHYDGDNWQEYLLRFRDDVLPRLLALSQAEFEGIQDICHLLHNVDLDHRDSLVLLSIKLPALVDLHHKEQS